jgi:hypothetical protein
VNFTGPSRRALAFALIALFAFSYVPHTHAHRSDHQDSPRRALGIATDNLTTACALDADVRPDRVTLRANGADKTITIRFGDTRRSEISFLARGNAAGNLVAGDIDHDGDVDLVWGATDPQSAVVLLNNGEGNFAEAPDNSPYASELDDLFGSNDPASDRKVKRGRKTSTLTSTSFHEIDLPLFARFLTVTIDSAAAVSELLNARSLFVCSVRKRGPPVVLS